MARISLDVWLPDEDGRPAAREPDIIDVDDDLTVGDLLRAVSASLEAAGVDVAHMVAGASIHLADGPRPRAIEAVLNPKTGRLYFGGPDGMTSRVPIGALVATARAGLFGDIASDPLPLAAVVEGGRGDTGAAHTFAYDFGEWLAVHGLETTLVLAKDGLLTWLGYALSKKYRVSRAGYRLRKLAADWVAHAITSPAALRVIVESKKSWVANDLARKMGMTRRDAERLLAAVGYAPTRSGDWAPSSKKKPQRLRAAWIADEADTVQIRPEDFKFLDSAW